MSLLHWWPIFVGLLAGALPVVVHFLTRPKPVRMPLSTIRFVREAVQQRRARQKLRDILILLLRVAAVLLLAFAIARPLVGQRSPVVASGDDDATRVVLLDVSQSMAAGEHGIQAFERARARAAESLAYRPALRANLLEAGALPHAAFDRCSTNFAALRQQLAAAAVRPERLNVRAALARAAEILAADARPAGRRELIVVSDFQRTNWTAADFSVLPEDTQIELESVAPEVPPPNLAILSVTSPGRAVVDRAVRFQVEVGNFTATRRSVQVELSIGEATLRLEGVCAAGETVPLSGEIVLRTPGWLAGECRLIDADDALAADNVRYLAVDVRAVPTCALLSRHNAGAGHAASYYLERALSPFEGSEASPSLRVTRVDPAQLEEDALATADLIVLDHPGKISAVAARRLVALLRRGRGVLYVASEPVDATNLQQLAAIAGSDWQLPVEFFPSPAGIVRRDLFLADAKRDRLPFRVFGDGLVEQLAPLRFGGGLATRQVEQAATDDIVAVYSDRSAALVITDCGAGALAVLNADLNSSNLPTSTAFVPLLGELVDRLLDRGAQSAPTASGEPAIVYLPPEAGGPAGLKVSGPGAEAEDLAEVIEDRLGTVLRWRAGSRPGIWKVERGDKTVFSAATVLPAEESDLRPLDAAILTERLAGGRRIEYRAAIDAPSGTDTAWSWVAAACVVCMLAEFAALRAYRT